MHMTLSGTWVSFSVSALVGVVAVLANWQPTLRGTMLGLVDHTISRMGIEPKLATSSCTSMLPQVVGFDTNSNAAGVNMEEPKQRPTLTNSEIQESAV